MRVESVPSSPWKHRNLAHIGYPGCGEERAKQGEQDGRQVPIPFLCPAEFAPVLKRPYSLGLPTGGGNNPPSSQGKSSCFPRRKTTNKNQFLMCGKTASPSFRIILKGHEGRLVLPLMARPRFSCDPVSLHQTRTTHGDTSRWDRLRLISGSCLCARLGRRVGFPSVVLGNPECLPQQTARCRPFT